LETNDLALTPTNNESFYREVDEQLRREQLSTFWKRYGRWLLVAAVLAMLAVAAYVWWRAEQREAAERESETLVGVVTQLGENRPQGTQPKIEQLAGSPREGYRAAALFTRAGVHLAEGRDAQAIAIYKQIAADGDLPDPYRNLALLRHTTLEFDRIAPQLVVERLRPLTAEGSPWRGSAGELLGAALLKQGRPREAAPVFAGIAKDPTVPETIRARATQMAGSLGIDATEDRTARGAAGNKLR